MDNGIFICIYKLDFVRECKECFMMYGKIILFFIFKYKKK